jgi:hypothetical protein
MRWWRHHAPTTTMLTASAFLERRSGSELQRRYAANRALREQLQRCSATMRVLREHATAVATTAQNHSSASGGASMRPATAVSVLLEQRGGDNAALSSRDAAAPAAAVRRVRPLREQLQRRQRSRGGHPRANCCLSAQQRDEQQRKEAAPSTGWAAATSARPAAAHCAVPTAGASSSNCSGREAAAPQCARHDDAACKRTPRVTLQQRLQRGATALREHRPTAAGVQQRPRERTTALQQGPLIAARRRLCICIAAGCDRATPPHTHTPPAPPKQHGRAR